MTHILPIAANDDARSDLTGLTPSGAARIVADAIATLDPTFAEAEAFVADVRDLVAGGVALIAQSVAGVAVEADLGDTGAADELTVRIDGRVVATFDVAGVDQRRAA